MTVIKEFFGGIMIMLVIFTRPAAIMNIIVTFMAAFLYHKGDITGSALTAFVCMIMLICIFRFGAGKFSIDNFINLKLKIND